MQLTRVIVRVVGEAIQIKGDFRTNTGARVRFTAGKPLTKEKALLAVKLLKDNEDNLVELRKVGRV